MYRNAFLAVMATTATAMAIAAPTSQAQSTTIPGAKVSFGDCVVRQSSHGYPVAACAIRADGVPYGKTVRVGYASSLKPFTPPTNGKWSKQRGTVTMSNIGVPGQTAGDTLDVISRVKLAFKGKTKTQVVKQLRFVATGSNAALTQPVATVVGK